MRAALLLLCACGGGLTSDAQPIISALVQDGDCFALITPDSPVAPSLGVSGTCSHRAEPRLLAGIDFVELVIDYGPDVTFAGTTRAPRPEVTVTVDGVESDVPIEISEEYRVGGRAYFLATFYAPAKPSTDVRISAGVNAGFRTILPDVFQTVAPQVGLALIECPQGTQCELAGAVGSAHLFITVPGRVSQDVAIHSVLGGVEEADPHPPVRTHVSLGHTEATVAIPVPSAPDFTMWTLSAQIGDGTPAQVSAIIRIPALIAQLSCGTSCNLGTGDAVGLEIIAPAKIRPLEALVETRINGVPQLVATPVTLVPRADGTAVGLLALTAPSTPGTWQIIATVAGYPAPAIVTSVQ